MEIIRLPRASKFPLLMPSQTVEEQQRGALVLDTRDAERFALLHIRGAMQLGLMGPFASWAAMLLKPDQDLVIVAEDEQHAYEAQIRLTRVGLERVLAYSLADENRWREQRISLGSIATQRCASVCETLQRGCSVQLIDVRSRAEWLQGHLPGAISIPLLDLNFRMQLIDPTKSSLVYCHEGYRATTAASILLQKSSANIGILIDGIVGWSACGLPLEVPHTTTPTQR